MEETFQYMPAYHPFLFAYTDKRRTVHYYNNVINYISVIPVFRVQSLLAPFHPEQQGTTECR